MTVFETRNIYFFIQRARYIELVRHSSCLCFIERYLQYISKIFYNKIIWLAFRYKDLHQKHVSFHKILILMTTIIH